VSADGGVPETPALESPSYSASSAVAAAPSHAAHLAHHFDTAVQQFSASKLGMWIFLCTEILLFSGLFCAYAVYRGRHPEIFSWGHHFLDLKWGGVNTIILLVSSFTVAWAVRCAQRGQPRRLALLLSLTLAGGVGFMAIKFVEYRAKWEHGLLWGTRFRPDPHYIAAHFGVTLDEKPKPAQAAGVPAAIARVADPKHGRELFLGTCASCHGALGEGMPGQAKDLRASEFLASQTDDQLLGFVKIGRRPWDPANTMKIDMPPRGGNPMFKDDDLRDIVAHVRVIQKEYQAAPVATTSTTQASSAPASAPIVLIDKWVVPPPPPGPSGLRAALKEPIYPSRFPAPPADAHVFFGIYFLLTGLHGLHVLAGMLVIAILLIGALRGRFSPAYFTPVDLGGLYWHLVDVIWIYLFPLLYLIH